MGMRWLTFAIVCVAGLAANRCPAEKWVDKMVADREHIHHRLLRDYDGSHRPAVLSLYFLTACFCLIAISFTRLHGYAVIVFLAVVLLLTYRILKNLGLISAPVPVEAERESS